VSGEPIRGVGRYDLLEVIGRGGAAVVYLAVQRDLGRRVALKELAPFLTAVDPDFARRFAAESRVAGSLSHPNIVSVYEYFESGGEAYIAMEFLPQGSLRRYVGALTLAQIAGLLEGVLAGLAHAASHSIVHRDLKPENLLVAADGHVKLADFGVARAYEDAATRDVVTATGTTIGTPAYMAPEQALGHDLGPAADLYSLGIIAWELLAGRVPFESTETPVAVLYKHVHEPVPPVRSAAPDVDPRIETWLQRMLAKDPADRFQSADAAWEELEDVVLALLGPRWRRDARLPVVDGEAAGHPLTPAVFDEGDATIHRRARRHDLEEDAPAEPSNRPRLGLLAVGGLLAAIAVAVVIVVLVGGGGESHATRRGATAKATPKATPIRLVTVAKPEVVATAVSPLVDGVQSKLDSAVARMSSGSAAKKPITPADQRVYSTALRKLAMQPAAITDAPIGQELDVTLQHLERDFGSSLAAERADNQHRYALASLQTFADQAQLENVQTEILKAFGA
jgi:hypothetical protein